MYMDGSLQERNNVSVSFLHWPTDMKGRYFEQFLWNCPKWMPKRLNDDYSKLVQVVTITWSKQELWYCMASLGHNEYEEYWLKI